MYFIVIIQLLFLIIQWLTMTTIQYHIIIYSFGQFLYFLFFRFSQRYYCRDDIFAIFWRLSKVKRKETRISDPHICGVKTKIKKTMKMYMYMHICVCVCSGSVCYTITCSRYLDGSRKKNIGAIKLQYEYRFKFYCTSPVGYCAN